MMVFDAKTNGLPRNTEAEKAFLLSCIHNPDTFHQYETLPSDFSDSRNRAVFLALSKLSSLDRPMDVANLIQIGREKGALPQMGGESYLNEFTFPPASHSPTHHGIIKQCATQRWMINLGEALVREATSGRKTPDEMLLLVEKAVSEGRPTGITEKKKTGQEILDASLERIEFASKNPHLVSFPVKTGIRPIDMALRGQDLPCYMVLAARPSVGKSALASQIGCGIAERDGNVFYASAEMTTGDQMLRMIAMKADISMTKAKTGGLSAYQMGKVREAHKALKTIMDTRLLFDDKGDISPDQIRARALAFKRKNGGRLDAIVVDYLQYLEYDEKTNNMYEKVSGISSALKNISKELNCLVLALAQIGRAGEEDEPQMHQLKDSGKIEQDADIVAILHPIKRRCQETDWKDVISFNICKGRSIGRHKFNLLFSPEATKFSEIDPALDRKISISREQWDKIDAPGADVFDEIVGKEKSREEAEQAATELFGDYNKGE